MVGYVIMSNGEIKKLKEVLSVDHQTRQPRIRTLKNQDSTEVLYKTKSFDLKFNHTDYTDTLQGDYSIIIKDKEIMKARFKLGTLYTVFINNKSDGQYEAHLFEVFNGNKLHMFWMFPQYLISVTGEIFSSVASQDLTYTQSPISMKSCASSLYFQLTFIAESLVGVNESIYSFNRLSSTMFFYAAMLGAAIMVFIYLAIRYKLVENKNKRGGSDEQT